MAKKASDEAKAAAELARCSELIHTLRDRVGTAGLHIHLVLQNASAPQDHELLEAANESIRACGRHLAELGELIHTVRDAVPDGKHHENSPKR